MTVDTDQLLIDHFGDATAIADLVGSRIWVDNTIPDEVEYNPGQGAAILLHRRGGRRSYVDGLRDPGVSIRVYGPSREAIRAVCDQIDLRHAVGGRSVSVIDVEWQDDSEPSTGWLFSYSFWTMRLQVA